MHVVRLIRKPKWTGLCTSGTNFAVNLRTSPHFTSRAHTTYTQSVHAHTTRYTPRMDAPGASLGYHAVMAHDGRVFVGNLEFNTSCSLFNNQSGQIFV